MSPQSKSPGLNSSAAALASKFQTPQPSPQKGNNLRSSKIVPMAKSAGVMGLTTKKRDEMVDLMNEALRRDITLACTIVRSTVEAVSAEAIERERAVLIWAMMLTAKLQLLGAKKPIASAVSFMNEFSVGDIATSKAQAGAKKVQFLNRALYLPALTQLFSPAPGKTVQYVAEDIRDTARVTIGDKPPELATRFPYLEQTFEQVTGVAAIAWLRDDPKGFEATWKRLMDSFDDCRQAGTKFEAVVKQVEAKLAV